MRIGHRNHVDCKGLTYLPGLFGERPAWLSGDFEKLPFVQFLLHSAVEQFFDRLACAGWMCETVQTKPRAGIDSYGSIKRGTEVFGRHGIFPDVGPV